MHQTDLERNIETLWLVEALIYDGLGHRVQKIPPGGSTLYVYDAFDQLAAEYATAVPAP